MLLVMVYHARPSVLTMTTSVLVSFLISGLLATGILLAQIENYEKIGFLDFYSRRIQRPLPASVVITTLSFLGVYLLLSVQWAWAGNDPQIIVG